MEYQDETINQLTALNDTTKQINRTTSEILRSMPQPENRAIRALNIAAAAVGVTSLITIIQQIIQWIRG
jgi:hypothetical protein